MKTSINHQILKIAEADDLHIAPFREDGKTVGTPTWIWSVAVDGELYVRAYNGQKSRWYQAAVKQERGIITSIGQTLNVNFEAIDDADHEKIDDAYRTKYGSSPYLASMIGSRARAATIKIHFNP
jgi:hypothetical protein